MIHKTAIVGTNVKLGKNVEIGPYCIIGDGAVIGDNVHFSKSSQIELGRRYFYVFNNNNIRFT